MSLPIFKNGDQPFQLMQTVWASQLNPFLKNPIIQGLSRSNIVMTASTPLVINHLLSRMMLGWFLIDNSANAVVWRTQPFNASTITLEASANTTISIWCF